MKMGILFVTEGEFVAVVGTSGFLWLAMIMITSLQVAFSILKLSFRICAPFFSNLAFSRLSMIISTMWKAADQLAAALSRSWSDLL